MSQPILSLRANSNAESYSLNRFHFKMQEWLLQMTSNKKQAAEKIDDARAVMQGLESRIKRTISEIDSISLDKVRSVIDSNESVAILAHDRDDNLCCAEINKQSLVSLKILDQAVWSSSKFEEWRKFYPRSYGEWSPPVGPFGKELPTVQTVRTSVEGVSIGHFSGKKLLIIPDAKTFGFPFALSPNGGDFLGENVSVGIAPSVSWLISTRSKPFSPSLRKCAWLGSSKSQDLTLLYLRDRLTPTLHKFQFNIIATESLERVDGSDIVLAISHGGVGIADHFRGISDDVKNYSTEEFADKFKKCGCIVLFICSSGRSDNKIGTMETLGVVSELLQIGVRSVIAPPWPLHAYVAETWLSPFLENIHSGNSVGLSSSIASREVRNRFNNPCAWAAFHVYGDPELCPIKV